MKHKLLIVDDETANLRMLERLFAGQYDVLTATSGEQGLEMLVAHDVALILSDQRMPGMTGLEFLKKASEIRAHTVRIILTGYTDADTLIQSINSGVLYRYITKPWSNSDLQQTLKRGMEYYEAAKAQKISAMENGRLLERLNSNVRAFANVILQMLDLKGPKLVAHSLRTAKHACEIARSLEMDDREIEQLDLAAKLHEVAHLQMPLHLLARTTLLRDGELQLMQEAFRQGVKMLAEVPELDEIAAVINFQHDHFDGLGSLNRLSGDQIPLHSRIIAIADAYDEMREPTSATSGLSHSEALLVLKGGAGRRFDPALVSIFCGLEFEEDVLETGSLVLAAA